MYEEHPRPWRGGLSSRVFIGKTLGLNRVPHDFEEPHILTKVVEHDTIKLPLSHGHQPPLGCMSAHQLHVMMWLYTQSVWVKNCWMRNFHSCQIDVVSLLKRHVKPEPRVHSYSVPCKPSYALLLTEPHWGNWAQIPHHPQHMARPVNVKDRLQMLLGMRDGQGKGRAGKGDWRDRSVQGREGENFTSSYLRCFSCPDASLSPVQIPCSLSTRGSEEDQVFRQNLAGCFGQFV